MPTFGLKENMMGMTDVQFICLMNGKQVRISHLAEKL